MKGRSQNSGQACAGSKRFIVHTSLADTFIAQFRQELDRLSPGEPLNAQTTLAPLSSKSALDRALQQIEEAVTAGAKVLMGGKRLDRAGYFLAPTLLSNVTPGNPAFH